LRIAHAGTTVTPRCQLPARTPQSRTWRPAAAFARRLEIAFAAAVICLAAFVSALAGTAAIS